MHPAWKVSVFRVILVRIFPNSDWIRIRTTPNTGTFYAVAETKILIVFLNSLHKLVLKIMHKKHIDRTWFSNYYQTGLSVGDHCRFSYHLEF